MFFHTTITTMALRTQVPLVPLLKPRSVVGMARHPNPKGYARPATDQVAPGQPASEAL